MKRHRFYIKTQEDPSLSLGTLFTLSPEDSHHIRHVLRLGKGVTIDLFDGKGREMEAVVDSFLPEGVKVRITHISETHGKDTRFSGYASLNTENIPISDPVMSHLCVELAVPFLKADKLEIVFRMASQLGASAFHIFLSKRGIPQPGDAGIQGKMKRWKRIILDSIRISKRSLVPSLHFFDSLEDLMKTVSEKKLIILAYEQSGSALLSDVLSGLLSGILLDDSLYSTLERKRNQEPFHTFDGIILVTGPEGGFTSEEVDMAVNYGAVKCSLGEGILKAETAPVAALSVILSFLGRI